MKKQFILLLLWGALNTGLFAQSLDSLQLRIDREQDVRKKIDLLNVLAFEAFDQDLLRSGHASQQAIELTTRQRYPTGLAWATVYQGVFRLLNGELPEATLLFDEAVALGEELNNRALLSYAWMQTANVWRDKGIFDSAQWYYRKASQVTRPEESSWGPLQNNIARNFLAQSMPDSAEVVLGRTNGKSHARTTLLLLAQTYQQQFRNEESIALLNQLEAAENKGSLLYLDARVIRGEIFFRKGDFEDALKTWNEVLGVQQKLAYKYALAYLLYRMGEAFEEEGFYDLALEYLTKALTLSRTHSYLHLAGMIHYEIAWVYYRNRNLELAIENVEEAERYLQRTKSVTLLSGCLNIRGLVKMAMNQYDSSLYYHLQGLAQREALGTEVGISSSLYNIGELYNKRQEYRKALPYLHRGIRIDEEIEDSYGRSLYSLQLGISYLHLKQFDSARFYIQQSMQLAIPTSATDVLRNGYFTMADFYMAIHKPDSAAQLFRQYIQLSDSVFNKQTTQSLAAYRTIYELGSKEAEIESLNREKKLAEAEAEKQRTYLYMVVGGLAILLFVTIFYVRFVSRLKKLNAEITKKGRQLSAQSNELQNVLNNLQKAQSQLVQSEKMASIGLLASGIAHELNNPLNFIKGGVEALKEELKELGTNEDQQKLIGIIEEGVSRSSAIIKGLGHYSRQSDRQNEVCDLHHILDNCLTLLNNKLKDRITIDRKFEASRLLINGNEGQLHQAFLNILSNAEQAISGQGVISIYTRESAHQGVIEIGDTGCGIAPENLEQLGHPFFTTKPPGVGTGLGLSISYRIFEAHQIHISVRSEVNRGTKFLFSFTTARP